MAVDEAVMDAGVNALTGIVCSTTSKLMSSSNVGLSDRLLLVLTGSSGRGCDGCWCECPRWHRVQHHKQAYLHSSNAERLSVFCARRQQWMRL